MITANEKTNIKRHHATKPREFTATFPLGSLAKNQKLNKLQKSPASSENMLVSFTATDKRATEASLRVSKILAKAMLPYSHAEIVKECMVEAMETLFPDKRDAIGKVKAIPLSRKTATGRIESTNDHLRMTLLTHIDQADYFSIAIDESTDIMDVAQLAVFIRFFDGEEMKELLNLVGLEGETTVQATCDALV
ncbi:protein FAM200A-like [Watersipora subatra]|uniref:protein FAM200A-like n=1 Tax=Watersipora subatra TaxID=2589382 RepID=UPI00355C967C